VTLVWPEVDVDQSGSLDLREFILCMRKVREVELKAVKFLGSQMDITGLFNERTHHETRVEHGLTIDTMGIEWNSWL